MNSRESPHAEPPLHVGHPPGGSRQAPSTTNAVGMRDESFDPLLRARSAPQGTLVRGARSTPSEATSPLGTERDGPGERAIDDGQDAIPIARETTAERQVIRSMIRPEDSVRGARFGDENA